MTSRNAQSPSAKDALVCGYVSDSPCGICVPRLRDALARLPEDGATKSRDYGRGYAQAVKDVLALVADSA